MNAFEWAINKEGVNPPDDFHCQTRDVAQARIEKMRIILERQGWSEGSAALLTAIIGELANNCFDHNLGQWNDIPGCWFEYNNTHDEFHAMVADRGQGILGSLKKVRPNLESAREALHLAFTEQLSGRSPENRGNGLKFVVRSLTELPSVYFSMHSGDATIILQTPIDASSMDLYIRDDKVTVGGTYAKLIVKKIYEN